MYSMIAGIKTGLFSYHVQRHTISSDTLHDNRHGSCWKPVYDTRSACLRGRHPQSGWCAVFPSVFLSGVSVASCVQLCELYAHSSCESSLCSQAPHSAGRSLRASGPTAQTILLSLHYCSSYNYVIIIVIFIMSTTILSILYLTHYLQIQRGAQVPAASMIGGLAYWHTLRGFPLFSRWVASHSVAEAVDRLRAENDTGRAM